MLYTLARQSEFQTDITLCSSNPQERSIKVFVKPRTTDEVSREIHSIGVEKLVPGVSYHGIRLATLTDVLRLGLTTEDLAQGKRAFNRDTNSAIVPAELRDTCYKFKVPWSVRTNGEKRGGVASEVRGLKSNIDKIDSVCASGLPDPTEREQLQRMRHVLTDLALNTRSNGFYSISVYESKNPSPHILVDLYRTVTHEGFHAREYALKASGKALTPQDMRGLVVRHPWIEASARTNGYGEKGLGSWIEEAMAHTVSGEGYSYVKSGVTLDLTKDPHAAYCDVIKLRDDFLKDYVVTWVKRNGVDGIRSLLPPESSAVRIAVDAGLRELSCS